jgi:hypothetical protein
MSVRFSKRTVVIAVAVLVAVLAAFSIWFFMEFHAWPISGRSSNYSAVYLTNGAVYFGKLSWFPSPHLTNVWFLQQSTNQQGQTQASLVPFTNLFWGPSDELYFNANQILSWTPLKTTSQLVKQLTQ